ncbi:alpha/beta fold hydrolase [Ramlibacter rhizophilus]|uniref:Alpha/beta fold hydrolase n=1 Tax=Ramlibacter rhizophilus TaxID=1781167 RepID=A0A4Z0BD67_9BURK|nr:alpha/beta fold hydrolase [Ramlibacter rhizophilus]TFY97245.1 alpha/beta fold hydrolase [Ramlibacter rhizophilus]
MATSEPNDLPALAARHPARELATAGGVVSFRESGQGTPVVVLLHGIGSGSGSWVRQLDALASQARVLAWDAPGYGRSAALPAPEPRAEDYGARVWQWLDAVGLGDERVVLVGHSLGALMASAATRLAPSRVRQLVLLSPAQGYGQAEAEVREAKRQDRLNNLHTLGPAGMADKRGAAMLSASASPQMVAYVKSIMAQVHPGGYEQATHMLAGAHLAGLLQGLPCPGLVACGDADGITTAAASRALAERAGLPYASLGPVGHACAIEAAEAVNRLIAERVRA